MFRDPADSQDSGMISSGNLSVLLKISCTAAWTASSQQVTVSAERTNEISTRKKYKNTNKYFKDKRQLPLTRPLINPLWPTKNHNTNMT